MSELSQLEVIAMLSEMLEGIMQSSFETMLMSINEIKTRTQSILDEEIKKEKNE